MHYRLSNENKEEKMFKSKDLFFAHFQRKQVIFLYRWKNTNILPQIFFRLKNEFFLVILAKKLEGLVR